MPIFDSDSDSQPSSSSRFSSRRRSLHQSLGGGHVADILFWRNKKVSAAILIGFTLIWFLFEAVEYPFITLLCQILIISMFVYFIWSNIGSVELIKWKPPTIDDIKISESTWRSLFSKLNQFMVKLYDISSGKDFRLFVVAVAFLWILSALGNYFNSLTLLYVVFICLETIPVFYERYQGEVNYVASKSSRDMKTLFNNLSTKVVNKIPRAPAKDKKPM